MDFQLVTGGPNAMDHLVFTTTFTYNNLFYKAALAETITWEGLRTGTYDVLLQSARGTQRFTLIKDRNHWRSGDEVEQIGVLEPAIADLLGTVINEVRK